ncbi:MAG: hypothetical protein ACK5OQ_08830 [Burkholderiales bacterium]|jgi:hypothetical protein
MTNPRFLRAAACVALLGLAGCASRPVNPPLAQVDPNGGYTFQTREKHFKNRDTLVVLGVASENGKNRTLRRGSGIELGRQRLNSL